MPAIDAINHSNELQNPQLNKLERFGIWMHEHPKSTKAAKIAVLVLGIGLLCTPIGAPVFGVGLVVGLAITGALLALTSTVSLIFLDLIAPPHHDMKTHVYKPGQCEGGKLYYEGDVPILSLDSDNPFKAGKAQGYLCGDAINRLYKRFDFVLHGLAKGPRAAQLPETIKELRRVIPTEYLHEIEGLVEGYNQWAKEHWWQSAKKLTVDDALLFHLMPDSCHFEPQAFERSRTFISGLGAAKPATPKQTPATAIACSSIIDRDPQSNNLVFARNMDWPSFGLAGAYSLVINRKHANGLRNTVEVGVPGFVGTLTGMNDRGLSLSMNVCSGTTTELKGLPACLYNRSCLENCNTVQDVESFVRKQSPLGAYHMTIADKNRAQSIHFYQSKEKTHVTRRWKPGQPLSTLNARYSPQRVGDMHHSIERQARIDHFFKHKKDKPLEDVLSVPYVNNWLTTHRVVMEPQTGVFKVAFDNAFAGKAPLQEVPTHRIFPIVPQEMSTAGKVVQFIKSKLF